MVPMNCWLPFGVRGTTFAMGRPCLVRITPSASRCSRIAKHFALNSVTDIAFSVPIKPIVILTSHSDQLFRSTWKLLLPCRHAALEFFEPVEHDVDLRGS